MQIMPLFDRILLAPIETPSVTNGIIIPKSQRDKSQVMSVIVTGSQTSTNLKQGDTVLIHRFAGTEFNHENQSYFIIKEIDILAKINKHINDTSEILAQQGQAKVDCDKEVLDETNNIK